MSDGNDFYAAIVGVDFGDQIRNVLEEIGQQMGLLTTEEQGFVAGVQANLDLGAPLTPQNIKTLIHVRNLVRQRAHLAVSRGG